MKTKYESVEDLLTDESFLAWYYRKSNEDVNTWEEWLKAHPFAVQLANEAVLILQMMSPGEREINKEQLEKAEQRLMKSIDKRKEFYYAPVKLQTTMMLKNYCKVAVRNLRKNKKFSAINIFGLSVGLAICLLISLFVIDELNYDRHNTNANRIFRIHSDIRVNGIGFNSVRTPPPMGPALQRDHPQIEKVVRLFKNGEGGMLVKKGDETLQDHNAVWADSSFFDVFTLPLVAGNPRTALTEPFSMVISEKAAKKYFNTTDVIGKTLLTDNTVTYKITGVFKDMPVQSHFHFDFIKAFSEFEASREGSWMSNFITTYLLVQPGIDEIAIQKYLDQAVKKYIGPKVQAELKGTLEELAKKGDYFSYTSMPLTKIHLHSHIDDQFEANGNIKYVYIFIVIALLILVIACVNFVNLSTARASGRSKEVGVRKVLGSQRKNLIWQFLVEALLMSFIALVLAVLLAALLIPYFNQLSGKEITLDLSSKTWLLPSLLCTGIIVGLMAGVYPAFYLSSFQPVVVLKGKLATGFKTGWLRNSLVVFQFAIAIILIVGTIVIYSQLQFIRNKDIGYNRDQVMVLENTYSLWVHAKNFKNEVLNIPGVTSATMTKDLPNKNHNVNGYFKDASLNINQGILLQNLLIDTDYVRTLGMKITKGRNFSPLMPTDSSAVLINEATARSLGYDDPINNMIYDSDQNNQGVAYRIIGVIKDYSPGSLHDEIPPMIFFLGEERGLMAFRINSKNIPRVISEIEKKYRAVELMSTQPFKYSFMDDDFNRLYQSDERTGKIFTSFAVLAILIACLGLFGLVTYAAEQRTKEIGIRKVLGASVNNIIALLSKDFLRLVMIAVLIAFPVGWWIMNKWLQDFAYRIDIGWWVFSIAGLIAVVIALVTVSVQAMRAAMANPVKSLRTE